MSLVKGLAQSQALAERRSEPRPPACSRGDRSHRRPGQTRSDASHTTLLAQQALEPFASSCCTLHLLALNRILLLLSCWVLMRLRCLSLAQLFLAALSIAVCRQIVSCVPTPQLTALNSLPQVRSL